MTSIPSHDAALWRDLCGKVLNLKIRDVAVIHKAANRCKGKMGDRTAGAAAPHGYREAGSCFMRLVGICKTLAGGDDLARQVACDFAHACLRVLDGEGTPPPFSKAVENGPPPRRAGKNKIVPPVRPYRADIDG